jgi:hypothetical protein
MWATTKGTIAPSPSNRSIATLTPPPNPGSGVAGTAYQFFTWYRVGAGNNHFKYHPIGCNGVETLTCHSVTHNGCSPVTLPMGPCRNAPNPTTQVLVQSCSPPNNVVPENSSGNGTGNINYGMCDVGYFCDSRTNSMINAGCKPCRAEMHGVVVTVTDSNGIFVSKQPILP